MIRGLYVEHIQRMLLPAVERAFEDAGKQLALYADGLYRKYGETLRLRTFAVVSLGFERVVGEEVMRREEGVREQGGAKAP